MSGNASRTRGRQRELAVLHHLESEGYVVYRLSRGCFDLCALRAGEPPLLIQVKSSALPFAHFGPADRVTAIRVAAQAGATAVLAHWPKGGQLKLIESSRWPAPVAVMAT